jgi:excisionase family DNA binding protein
MPAEFINIEQAAELLLCSIKTVRRRVSDGSLPAIQLGDKRKALRFDRARLLLMISQASSATSNPPPKIRLSGPLPRWAQTKKSNLQTNE